MHYTMRQNANVKKISSDKMNITKKCTLFFRMFQLITVLLLMRDSYMS